MRHPGSRFIYASSSSIYGQADEFPTPETALPRPHSPYGTTKLAGEHLCGAYHRNFGLQTVTLRFFTVYGPRQRPDMAFTRFCRAALGGDPVTVFGDGRQTRDFTFVTDAVSAVRSAAVAPAAVGGTYNLGGGSQVSLRDALELLQDLADRPVDVRYCDSQHGDVRDTRADTTRAQRDLGFSPQTPFEEGLRAQFAWAASTLPVG